MRRVIVHGRVFALATARPPRRGRELGALSAIEDGAVAVDGDRIVAVGPTTEMLSAYPDWGPVVDAEGRAVIPGFVDCHTHLPFAGWRADEYRQRLAGRHYEEIAGKQGGIARSRAQLREQADADILRFSQKLAGEMLASGTTTVEMKSGYGLTFDDEMRQLRLIARLRSRLPQRVSATGLFLHAALPDSPRGQWIRTAVHDLLPAARTAGLVDAIDAFVERTAFSPDEVRPLMEAAWRLGLNIRLHTDQFSRLGGTALGIAYQARGLDHLDHIADDDIVRLARSNSVAVLLPAATYSMNQTVYPPARRLIEAGAAIAIATDFNPGTAPISNMPLIISMAVHLYGMSPEEALSAATINAAYVLGLENEVGSLEAGKRADILILDSDRLEMIPYRAGHNPLWAIMVAGRLARHR